MTDHRLYTPPQNRDFKAVAARVDRRRVSAVRSHIRPAVLIVTALALLAAALWIKAAQPEPLTAEQAAAAAAVEANVRANQSTNATEQP